MLKRWLHSATPPDILRYRCNANMLKRWLCFSNCKNLNIQCCNANMLKRWLVMCNTSSKLKHRCNANMLKRWLRNLRNRKKYSIIPKKFELWFWPGFLWFLWLAGLGNCLKQDLQDLWDFRDWGWGLVVIVWIADYTDYTDYADYRIRDGGRRLGVIVWSRIYRIGKLSEPGFLWLSDLQEYWCVSSENHPSLITEILIETSER